MIQFQARTRQAAGALALLCVTLWAPSAHAYRWYDNGSGSGCVSCHTGFVNGTGPLHLQHRTLFGATTCNLCHPSGGGTTPVLTYTSGAGGGYGCAGCHGQDYGETSPNSGQPKATAYGLRLLHVAQGVANCGTSSCHAPGSLGHPNPFPTPYGEDVAPPYFDSLFSDLTDPCASSQEDIPFDLDSVGLDNDGDGVADYSDSDCPAPPDTPTPTPTSMPTATQPPPPGVACGTAPAVCIDADKGSLLVDQKTAGKEKLKVTIGKLQPTVTQGQFGNPVTGTTSYAVCIYNAANQLQGEYSVAQAGATCAGKPCWAAISDKGYKYKDKAGATNGITKIKLSGGDAGKGKVKVGGKGLTLPAGVAAALQNEVSATVQVLSSDAACFSVGLTEVKKADGLVFSATGP